MSGPGNVFSRHYRSFRTMDSKYDKTRKFIVKFVGLEFGNDYEEYFKKILSPVDVSYVSEPKTTTLGENPVDFPLVAYGTMTTFEIHTQGSITVDELKMMIYETTRLPFKYYWITTINDPTNKNTVDYQRLINQIEGKSVDYFPEILGYEPNVENTEEEDYQDLVGQRRIKELFKQMKEDKNKKR